MFIKEDNLVLPQYLVETDWLAAHLTDDNLRVLDCTVFIRRNESGESTLESGRQAWEEAHIPGSGFADLNDALSDSTAEHAFMMPPADQFAAVMSDYGVGTGTQVVLYDRNSTIWAARVWWMLRVFGFDSAAILNGGWHQWQLENRPISDEPPVYPPATFAPHRRLGLIATKADVLAKINDGATCTINSLQPEQHQEQHIPGSVNFPAWDMLDPETHRFLEPDLLRETFARLGATQNERIITYCGGGIAASSTAFILSMLGAENVAVYDGSLSEWMADPELPLGRG